MLRSVFTPEICAACKNCCVFEPQSAWEVPTFPEKTAKRLKDRPEYRITPENGRIRITLPYAEHGGAQPCPFLDPETGCTLPPDEKPFACSLWPVRLMRRPDGTAAPAVYRGCPGVPDEKTGRLRELLQNGLLDRILREAERDPSLILPYHANYTWLFPDERSMNMTNYPAPERVFHYFDAISQIPRGSGNTAGIRAWCLKTAEAIGISAHADAAGNVILRKNAFPGYENRPGVILQGHLDMVCAKLPDCPKNMDTEPVDLIWGADTLTAGGTTLGGDDGIAIAYAFALLESADIPHPPLTVILTADEETGMFGAAGLSPDELTGIQLINLDSEEEGIFTVGCAGGVRVQMRIPVQNIPADGAQMTLRLTGLTGGHSGSEIHKPLLNANKVMGRLLGVLAERITLCAIHGGVRDNVIATECTADICIGGQNAEEISRLLTEEMQNIRQESPAETGITLQTEPNAAPSANMLTQDDTKRVIDVLAALPNGVQSMNERLHLPQTSLNLGVLTLDAGTLTAWSLVRSSSNAEKAALAEKLHLLCEQAGGSWTDTGSYPAWEYQPDTKLEQTAVSVFRKMYGRAPSVETIHAGLECGILAAKKPGLECISLGPDLRDVHTPRETLSIPSAARTWEFLCALLRAL